MRFLIDNALPPGLAGLLRNAGHDAVHVRAYEMQAASDETVLARAAAEDRVLLSADSDFSTILATREDARPSFILFREADLVQAGDYLAKLLPVLSDLEPELKIGCVAVFRRGRLRIRRLPFAV